MNKKKPEEFPSNYVSPWMSANNLIYNDVVMPENFIPGILPGDWKE